MEYDEYLNDEDELSCICFDWNGLIEICCEIDCSGRPESFSGRNNNS